MAYVYPAGLQVDVFLRQDQPDLPVVLMKLVFTTEEAAESYLVAKRMELDAEGWREERLGVQGEP